MRNKALQKIQKDISGKTMLKYHKGHLLLIGDCRNDIAGKPLTALPDHRRPSFFSPSGPLLVVGTQARLSPHQTIAFSSLGPANTILMPQQ
jgi:hypothetical protein